MKEQEQLEIDWCKPLADGYSVWESDRQEALKKIAELWGLPLGKVVRLQRRGIDGEFEGRLDLATMPKRLKRKIPLELKMGRMTFASTEVEACSVVKGDSNGE